MLNRLFGVTLWCETLVLQKDNVTQCIEHGECDTNSMPVHDVLYQMVQRQAVRLMQVISRRLKGRQYHARQCIGDRTASLMVIISFSYYQLLLLLILLLIFGSRCTLVHSAACC